jgi:DNA-binding transcriptional LysR family regulator
MNYTLHQLQVFAKVVQTKSVTKAAKELFLTQPGVSIQLRNFQDQFDIPLTEVIGRQIYITDFGEEIATLAANILDQVSTINYKTAAYKGLLSGRLKLSIVSTGKYVMPYFLTSFLKKNPGIELKMDVTNKASVLKALESNEADFGLVSILPDKLAVDEEILLPNKLFLVGNSSYVPSTKLTKEAISQLPMIYRENGSATRLIMESFFSKVNIKANKQIELTSNEAVKQAVIAGLGYSIMPLIGIRNELKSGELQIIEIEGLPILSDWRLIWLKGKNHSPITSAFLKDIQENKQGIMDNNINWL